MSTSSQTKILNYEARSTPQIIPFSLVDRDEGQPRKNFNDASIERLAKSIQLKGLLHPIYVKKNKLVRGRFIIVSGERRVRALRDKLGVTEFRLHILDENEDHYFVSLMENEMREDLNPMERAESYQEYMKRDGLTVAQLAEKMDKSEEDIYRFLRLLQLPPEVQQLVREGKLKHGNLRTLLQFRDFQKQIDLAYKLVHGENPPEIDEADSHPSERSQSAILARLPKTPDGLIRKLLKYRTDVTAMPIVIEVFLELSLGEQVAGWEYFTALTRENFHNNLATLIGSLQALEQSLISLPGTKKRILSGAAAVRQGEVRKAPSPPPQTKLQHPILPDSPAPPSPPPPPPPPKNDPPTIVRQPLIVNGHKPPEEHLSIRREGRANAERCASVFGYLFCNPERHGRVNLSRERLKKVMALPVNINPQTLALGVLRAAWASWSLEPGDLQAGPHRKFLEKIGLAKTNLGARFQAAMNAAWIQDQSTDPIDLAELFK